MTCSRPADANPLETLMEQQQLTLFPDTEVTGTGRPIPWPVAQDDAGDDTMPVQPAQVEELPLGSIEDAA